MKRNDLLASQLSDLLNGRQGVLKYLDHCATIMTLKNQKGVNRFIEMEINEEQDLFDREWSMRNRIQMVHAAHRLYLTLHPRGTKSPFEILQTVNQWSCQKEEREMREEWFDD